MTSITHRGHVQLAEAQRGATLVVEPGRVTLEIASPGDMPNMPERIDLIQFTSNSGYFTLINLFRRDHNIRLGVAGLSTYIGGLALESAHFSSRQEMRSRSWTMVVGDVARILHVNGVQQHILLPDDGTVTLHWVIASSPSVALQCDGGGVTVRLGQHVSSGGDAINGPTIRLTYPADLEFREEVDLDAALTTMHRVRQLFSMIMGRVLPILSASMTIPGDGAGDEVGIHGLLTSESADKPVDRLIATIDAGLLAPMLDRWLARYDELEDAIRLHMSALEQRRLPPELRFQIFVQALESLHRRTQTAATLPIDRGPIVETLRQHGIASDVVDRVAGNLAHAHEPGLRQRLRHYWDLFADEISVLRPDETRRSFVGRVAATRNHYAHRTDRDDQVLQGSDLWDATETVKAISHMALLREVGADTVGIARMMLDRRFTEYTLRPPA